MAREGIEPPTIEILNLNKDIEYPVSHECEISVHKKKSKIIPVEFDDRPHEVRLDCVLTFRGYASSANDFLGSVLCDRAGCMNSYF